VRALEMAPRMSGGVAHAWLSVSVSGVDAGTVWSQYRAHLREECVSDRDALRPDNLVPFVREILVSELH
jgi:hypothetical protein